MLQAGCNCLALQCDVTDAASVDRMADELYGHSAFEAVDRFARNSSCVAWGPSTMSVTTLIARNGVPDSSAAWASDATKHTRRRAAAWVILLFFVWVRPRQDWAPELPITSQQLFYTYYE